MELTSIFVDLAVCIVDDNMAFILKASCVIKMCFSQIILLKFEANMTF